MNTTASVTSNQTCIRCEMLREVCWLRRQTMVHQSIY